MNRLLFVFTLVISLSTVFGLQAQNKNKAIGKWKYEVSQAPYGYDTGIIEIKEQKNVLGGEVFFNSGYGVKLQKVTLQNDTLRTSTYVDSEYVDIVAHIKDKKMEGIVDTSMGKMKLKAEKVVNTQN